MATALTAQSGTGQKTFLLPDLGEGLTEAELVRWLVAVGDTVAVDQPVAEVETAKAVVEVPTPFAGTVAQLHGEAGSTIDVGTPLITIAEVTPGDREATRGAAREATPGAREVGASAGEEYRTEERAGARPPSQPSQASGSGNVLIGYGTPAGTAGGRTRRRKAAAASSAPASVTAAPPRTTAPEQAVRVVSPIVRRLARDLNVPLSLVSGTGPHGLIMRRDVESAGVTSASQGATSASPGVTSASQGVPSTAEVDARTGLGVAARTPVAGVRKAVAQAMVRSRTEIPEATVWVDADATELVRLRADLKRRDPESAPSLLAFIARFVLAGLAKFPELNTRIEGTGDGGQQILQFDGVNLGFAAQTNRGLVVPAIRGAHTMSARQLDGELRRLTALARDGKASPADLTGGTFTLNNYGVFGVDGSAAIINHPEAAILGVGRIIDRPWAVDGTLAVRKVVQLTLTFDHRVCDGGTAGGFLRFVADAVEQPGGVLADL
ncbi:branched-chain alpha-keto acid dehydrogenase subunit E2 [Sinomonas atrocyanea]|uniref:Dihydrolipoamide acetyltransferase component of pyruvate dehydrogenase complex n=1 Tax=Sinomonas atrocyanea TaxID=37927 RepID=A0A127A308_9MICC|nr:dihydrolipoamide acetyltransferase family protein [Sinomonas atrocyanea]AMM33840.1 branched-chain alpha-keto acid dehydrogenase subunit E2 [Sinomonas atrocyanea]GEB66460.1 dihydrolipoamide acetyltransferase component of pyruvate dehydrogenase complex [Sinomonas atrocyanea]GGG82007.1 dihydrolipoamide acetyltransferase component of pyruvate dehydrogenase complex [Sinomonas atrocyanea]